MNNGGAFSLKSFFRKRWLLVTMVVFVVVLSTTLYALLTNGRQEAPGPGTTPIPTIVEYSPERAQGFTILSTSPRDGETDVYPGEITITLNSNAPILPSSLNIEFSPNLPYYWRFRNENTPTTRVLVDIYGGLEKNTRYEVRVKSLGGSTRYSFAFTTSSEQPESSSRLVVDEDNRLIEDYYPLAYIVPYESPRFSVVEYSDRLTLVIEIKQGTQEEVSQAVRDWIRQNGVDPDTHALVFR